MPSDPQQNLVIWNIQFDTAPSVLHYCKKCGKPSVFVSSGEFRINAQQKSLDIWLIYNCSRCHTTWNSTIYSRVSPQQLNAALLEQFHNNDKYLAMHYAMNPSLLQKNGAVLQIPPFQVLGEEITLEQTACIKIQSQYYLPIKISSIIKKKMGISQREYHSYSTRRHIHTSTGQDLNRCRLTNEVILTIR